MKNSQKNSRTRRDILTKKGLICARCEILLSSKLAGDHDGKHCEDCQNTLMSAPRRKRLPPARTFEDLRI